MRIFGRTYFEKKAAGSPVEKKNGGWFAASGKKASAAQSTDCVAWENGAVLAGYQWLQRTFSEAPIVVDKMVDGDWVLQPEHPAAVLTDNPNPYYSGRLMWSGVLLSLVTAGHGYIIKARNLNGTLKELHYASHSDVLPVSLPHTKEYIDYFEYTVNGVRQPPLKPDDVVYIRTSINPSNHLRAINPMCSIENELATDNVAGEYQRKILKRNGKTVILTLKESDAGFDDDDAERVRKVVSDAMVGDTVEPPLLEEPIEIHTIGMTPEELSLKEMISGAEQRITSIIGIHPMLLGLASGNDSRTYSNMEEARQAAYESYILPLQAQICDALNRALLPEFAKKGERLRFRFDTSAVRVLQEDADALHTRWRENYKVGLCDRATFKSKVGEPVLPEDEGVYYDSSGLGAPTPAAAAQAQKRLQNRIKAMRKQVERKEDQGAA